MPKAIAQDEVENIGAVFCRSIRYAIVTKASWISAHTNNSALAHFELTKSSTGISVVLDAEASFKSFNDISSK